MNTTPCSHYLITCMFIVLLKRGRILSSYLLFGLKPSTLTECITCLISHISPLSVSNLLYKISHIVHPSPTLALFIQCCDSPLVLPSPTRIILQPSRPYSQIHPSDAFCHPLRFEWAINPLCHLFRQTSSMLWHHALFGILNHILIKFPDFADDRLKWHIGPLCRDKVRQPTTCLPKE